jgi:hypothetical protein
MNSFCFTDYLCAKKGVGMIFFDPQLAEPGTPGTAEQTFPSPVPPFRVFLLKKDTPEKKQNPLPSISVM